MKSKKTTIAGVALAVALCALAGYLYHDGASVEAIITLVAAVSAAAGGVFARDNDQSSEDVGIK